jgi:hypothetical protein
MNAKLSNIEFLLLGNKEESEGEEIWRNKHRKITGRNHCYICFLDILGFKELLAQNNLTELQETLEKFTKYISGSVYKRKTNADELKRSKEGNNNNNRKLKILIISDSIVITTENQSFKALATLIDRSIDFISASYKAELALRGVITKSNLLECSFMDNDSELNMNILWSAGIAKAFQQEKSLEISGCAIDPEITVLENFLNEFPDYKNKIIKYKVPLKDMKTEEMYMINWLKAPFFPSFIANPTENPPDPDLENIKEAFLRTGTIENLEPSIKTKLENTITLYNYLKGLKGNKE